MIVVYIATCLIKQCIHVQPGSRQQGAPSYHNWRPFIDFHREYILWIYKKKCKYLPVYIVIMDLEGHLPIYYAFCAVLFPFLYCIL